MTRVRTHPGQIAGPEFRGRVVLTRKVDGMPMPFEPRGPYFVPIPVDSAGMAKQRLLAVVAADREACPAWRWVFDRFTGSNNMGKPGWLAPRVVLRWERRR